MAAGSSVASWNRAVERDWPDGGPLGVEQDEQAGDAVVWVDGVVVQQPAGLLPLAAR
jgi:hypothetical protein